MFSTIALTFCLECWFRADLWPRKELQTSAGDAPALTGDIFFVCSTTEHRAGPEITWGTIIYHCSLYCRILYYWYLTPHSTQWARNGSFFFKLPFPKPSLLKLQQTYSTMVLCKRQIYGKFNTQSIKWNRKCRMGIVSSSITGLYEWHTCQVRCQSNLEMLLLLHTQQMERWRGTGPHRTKPVILMW